MQFTQVNVPSVSHIPVLCYSDYGGEDMDAKNFGAFIAERRKAKNMTQADLASKLQITDKAISRWERGKGFPDISLLMPLADALELSLMELMRSERIEADEICLADDKTAADLMADAVEMERFGKRQGRIINLTATIGTLAIAVLIWLSGHANIGGALTAGVFISFVPVGLSLLLLNRKDRKGRKAYGFFTLITVGFALFLLNLCNIEPIILLMGLYIILGIVILSE